MLCQQVDTLKLQLENAESQRHFFAEEHAKAHEAVQSLHMEREDLIRTHTQEVGNLRHQVRFLKEQLESSPAPAMSAAPSSTGFTDFNLDMDHLQLEDQPWDRFINVPGHDNLDASDYLGNTAESFATIQPIKSAANPSKQDGTAKNSTVDQPIASGILFMLLLCGAFVASRSATTSSHPAIPKVPEEVRVASTEVLNNLLKDNPREASLFLPDLAHNSNTMNAGYDGRTTQWNQPRSTSSHIGSLHERLTSPSRLQEAEQAFSLTPAQYNALNHYPGMDEAATRPIEPQPTHRRNLAETLKNMREASMMAKGGGMAEVYTRSLLWDQIPEDVVRRFRQMVADSHAEDAEMKDNDTTQ